MREDQIRSFYQRKNVLVTGGSGFIGSHIVERLINYGAHVTILDNFSTGCLKNLSGFVNKITILYADICNAFSLLKATRQQDIVFHLAAFVSVAQSVKQPDLCHMINVQGTQNLLDNCRLNGVKTVVFSSSSAVYGDYDGPCTENSPTNPQSPYANSKLAGEALCKKFALECDMNTACLRYFNVYGERQNPQGEYAAVVAKFKYALQNNLPLIIFGDGNQTRDFVQVSDVVDANVTIGMQSNLHGDIFNIGTGKSINLLQLIEKLEKEFKTKAATITYQPARMGDILHSHANCEKFQKLVYQ
jgi:UDP-glucose 4-epimerase